MAVTSAVVHWIQPLMMTANLLRHFPFFGENCRRCSRPHTSFASTVPVAEGNRCACYNNNTTLRSRRPTAVPVEITGLISASENGLIESIQKSVDVSLLTKRIQIKRKPVLSTIFRLATTPVPPTGFNSKEGKTFVFFFSIFFLKIRK